MSTLEKVREKLAAKQADLGKVFTEAKTSDGKYDFSKVSKDTVKSVLGDGMNSTVDMVKRINELDSELVSIAQEAEGLEAAEKAASNHAAREKARGRVILPGLGGDRERPRVKSLGELVAEEKAYQAWAKSGAAGGITFNYPDVLPSDLMAMGMAFDTLQSKALMARSAGFAPESIRLPGFVEGVTRPIQLIDIIPMSPTGQAAIKYMEETTRTHGAAATAEGGDYAESTFVFTEKTSPVEKITDSLPVTDEQLSDVPMMEGYVNSRLIFGVRQKLDGLCYTGDGAAPNLRGIINVVGIQNQARGGDPAADAFFKAMTKIRVTGRALPTHHVMHPTDWQNIRLTRTADGIYIWGNPSEAGPERLWGLPVVQNDARAAGSGLTGSFQPAWISLFELAGVDVQVGYVGTQFTQGKRTVRADMRAALTLLRPAAFCDVTGLAA